MAELFRLVTDQLFGKLSADDLAAEIGCSVQAIKQARMDENASGYRQPPDGWEKAARKLAMARAADLTRLAAKLNPRE